MHKYQPQPNHILIIPSWYPNYPGHIQGCFFREQALALKRHGHQVGVIDVKFRLPRSLKLLFNGFFGTHVEIDEGLMTYRFCGVDWFRYFSGLRTWLWLLQGIKLVDRYIAQHGRPDLIHAHAMLNGGLLAKAVSAKYSVPFVVTEHSSAFASGHISKQKMVLARGVSTSAVRRFAVSGAFCRLLEQQFDDGLHWEEMPNIIAQQFIAAELSVPPEDSEPFSFLTVAQLTKGKAINNLLMAFSQAFGNNLQVVLKIAGDGSERPHLEELVIKLGMAGRVQFLGMLTREQVLEEMLKTNIFVLPSRYETFGVVIIEALALGNPVIATRCGGPESIVREQDGILIPVDDIPALGNAMQKMHSSYASYDVEEIRSSCIERYSEATVARRLSHVYSEVLAAHNEMTN